MVRGDNADIERWLAEFTSGEVSYRATTLWAISMLGTLVIAVVMFLGNEGVATVNRWPNVDREWEEVQALEASLRRQFQHRRGFYMRPTTRKDVESSAQRRIRYGIAFPSLLGLLSALAACGWWRSVRKRRPTPSA